MGCDLENKEYQPESKEHVKDVVSEDNTVNIDQEQIDVHLGRCVGAARVGIKLNEDQTAKFKKAGQSPENNQLVLDKNGALPNKDMVKLGSETKVNLNCKTNITGGQECDLNMVTHNAKATAIDNADAISIDIHR